MYLGLKVVLKFFGKKLALEAFTLYVAVGRSRFNILRNVKQNLLSPFTANEHRKNNISFFQ